MSARRWTDVIGPVRQVGDSGVCRASCSLASLVAAGVLSQRRAAEFTETTGLADFFWEATWADPSGDGAGDALATAQGCVILIHGWDGSHAIWEDIPARICHQEPRLFVLAPDINGFGSSPFVDELPELALCDPSAAMRSVEHWVDILGLRSSTRARHRYRVLTFVGHSMGGAATFYLDESVWRPHEVARLGAAPALLFNDLARKEFYKTLGLGIWAGSPTKALSWLKKRLAPRLINALIGDASQAVKDEHLRVFNRTPKGILAQTFYAMGAVPRPVERSHWQHFRVLLGHRDRLVGISPILLLLEELGFSSEDISVFLGDHYFFSVGRTSRRLHAPNRDRLVQHVIELHRECYLAQRGAT